MISYSLTFFFVVANTHRFGELTGTLPRITSADPDHLNPSFNPILLVVSRFASFAILLIYAPVTPSSLLRSLLAQL